MRRGLLIIIPLFVVIYYSFNGITMDDMLECHLPNGDEFKLVAEYDWVPAASIMPKDVAKRLNMRPFSVYYLPGDGKSSSTVIAGISYQNIKYEHVRNNICSAFRINGKTIVAGNRVRFPDTYFVDIPFPYDKFPYINIFPNDRFEYYVSDKTKIPQKESIKLIQLGLDIIFGDGAIAKINNQVIIELSIESSNESCAKITVSCPVIAVWQTKSLDGGKTWSDLIITKKAMLFKLGKTRLNQTGIAKPSKYFVGPGA